MKLTDNQKLIVCGVIAIVIIIPIFFLIFNEIGLASQNTGYIEIRVVDGYTGKPLKGAVVVIPEFDQKYITDSDGKTAKIKAAIKKDRQYDGILPQNWGRITILAYVDGYETYALFYVAIWPDKLREGPVLFMFPEGSAEEGQPFTVIEAPQNDWVNELIKKYKPD